MLHEQDTSLLLLHPEKSDKIFRMDLNRGDIVEEWVWNDSIYNYDHLFFCLISPNNQMIYFFSLHSSSFFY